MGSTEKPAHDCRLWLGRDLLTGDGSLCDDRASPNPRIGIQDDCYGGMAEPNYVLARLESRNRFGAVLGSLCPAPLPAFLFREVGRQHLYDHCGYLLPWHLGDPSGSCRHAFG